MNVPKPRTAERARWRPEVVTDGPATPSGGGACAERLKAAAAPVLDELATHLRDGSLCVALADHDSLIIETRVTDNRLAPADVIGVVPGGTFAEPTPIPATVARRSDERTICYAQSIQHPLTGDVEGMLVISGAMPRANPLFMPYLRHAVKDITQRLMGGSHDEKLVLAGFQDAARDRSRAVAVLSDDLVLTTPAAADLLLPADHATLRKLGGELGADGALSRQLELTAGIAVDVEASRMRGTTGVLFRLNSRHRRDDGGLRIQRQLRQLRGTPCPVVITGEPGAGRTHAVQVVAGTDPVATLDAAEVPVRGEGAWVRCLRELATQPGGVIAVEEIQLLPATLCVRLSALLAESPARFVLTSTPPEGLPPHVANLASSCMYRVELPPLRRRRDELPGLVQALAREARPGLDISLAPSALAALSAQQWRGNLRELAMVVRHAAASRTTGEITAADLPEAYRMPVSMRPLTPWQQAEHDAIVSALRATGGNKRQAAARLGISRTTLYNRIRALKITV